MENITKLFDKLDAWRHLPNYQLERRADIFFSLYLPEVLEQKVRYTIKSDIVPEFPARIGTLYPTIETDKSYKIDYVAISQDNKRAYLVELKTEMDSKREEQDKYLCISQTLGFNKLLKGLLKIFGATQSKRKYYHLLLQLEKLDLLKIPASLNDKIRSKGLHGITELSKGIKIISPVKETKVIYVQPTETGEGIINFKEFANVVKKHDDPVSQRFAASLLEWANIKAGTISSKA